MKGIILAGGTGSRLFPLTFGTSKQLLPIFDKPMIYYPLSVLMLAGIREILIICRPEHLSNFKSLLKKGEQFGIKILYELQNEPLGIADAFRIGESFIRKDSVALVLGDNMFFGHNLIKILKKAKDRIEKNGGSEVFCYKVKDPERYGVLEQDTLGKVKSIEEKPSKPKSNFAIVGLYFFDHKVKRFAKYLKPSERGELEITDIIKIYMKEEKLKVSILGRGFAWLDTGTHSDLHEASSFVRTIQDRQGLQIACPDEIGFNSGWIDKQQLLKNANSYRGNNYGDYLKQIINSNNEN